MLAMQCDVLHYVACMQWCNTVIQYRMYYEQCHNLPVCNVVDLTLCTHVYCLLMFVQIRLYALRLKWLITE
jgi:hypothetical protein